MGKSHDRTCNICRTGFVVKRAPIKPIFECGMGHEWSNGRDGMPDIENASNYDGVIDNWREYKWVGGELIAAGE